MRIKLAPTSREKPAAIEKNAAEEEMSRMVAGGFRSILQHQPDPSSLYEADRAQRKRRPCERPSLFCL